MGVIVISLRTPWSTGENFGCTWERQEALATSLGAPATSLGAPMTFLGALTTSLGAPTKSLGALTTSLGAPGSSSDKAVWEKQYHLWARCWCAWKSQLLLIVQRFLQLI